MDRWVIQDHTVKDGQSLDCGHPGTVPRATNACQCSQPPTSLRVRGRSTWRSTQIHTHAPGFHTVFSPCCSVVQSLHPSPPQLHRQSCQWGSSYPRRGVVKETWMLQRLLASRDWFLSQWPWAFELEMHLRIKAEELPGGTVLQQRTVWISEELRKCTFLERIKEMFYFEIENLRIRILKGASALYCI